MNEETKVEEVQKILQELPYKLALADLKLKREFHAGMVREYADLIQELIDKKEEEIDNEEKA